MPAATPTWDALVTEVQGAKDLIVADEATIAGLTAQVASLTADNTVKATRITNLVREETLLGVMSFPALGAYAGGGGFNPAANMAAFEAWLGAPAAIWDDFAGKASWADFEATVPNYLPKWAPLRDQGKTLCYATGLLTDDTKGQFANGNLGNFDTHYSKVANDLADASFTGANCILRPGHEMNGNWYPWAAKNQTAAYISLFQRFVTVVRGVYAARSLVPPKIDCCVSLGWNDFDWNAIWPGAAFVDYLGMDVYNWCWDTASQATPQSRWSYLVNQSAGLAKHVSRAATWGVPCTVPEWGTGPTGGTGGPGVVNGGDDAYFVDQMWKWMATHNYAHHCYWNHTSAFDGILSNDSKPLAGAAYRSHWGG